MQPITRKTALFILLIFLILGFIILPVSRFHTQNPESTIPPVSPADHCLERAILLFARAEYDSALCLFRKAAALYDEANDLTAVVKCYSGAGDCYLENGEYGKAREFFESAEKIAEGLWGKRHAETAALSVRIGRASSYLGNDDDAFERYTRALAVFNDVYAGKHLDIAQVYHALGTHYLKKSLFQNALDCLRKALSMRLDLSGSASPEVAETYTNIGIVYSNLHDLESALDCFDQALAIDIRNHGETHPEVLTDYFNMGNVFVKKGDYDQGLEFFLRSLSIARDVLGEGHPTTSAIYHNLGTVHEYKNDYHTSLEYYRKSLSIDRNRFPENHPRFAIHYMGLGNVYAMMGDTERGLAFYDQALIINRKHFGEHHPNNAVIFHNIADAHITRNQEAEALVYLEKSLSLFRRFFGESSAEAAECWKQMGIIHTRNDDFTTALRCLDEALSIGLKVCGNRHPLIAELYLSHGDAHFAQHRFIAALKDYDDAIDALILDSIPETGSRHQRFANVSSKSLLLNALASKAQALERHFAIRSRDIEDLYLAVAIYEEAFDLIDHIRMWYKSEDAKLFFNQKIYDIYPKAVGTALALYGLCRDEAYRKKAFSFAERGKACVLVQNLLDSKAKRFARIPRHIIMQERQLKIDIAFYEKSLFEESQKKEGGDDVKIAQWQDKLFTASQAYDHLIRRLERQYPDYYNLKYKSKVVTISELRQKILDHKTAVVEYFIGDTSLTIFTLTDCEFTATTVPWHTQTEERIHGLRNGLLNREISDFANHAHFLYLTLIRPVESYIEDKVLIIIPDGILCYIPFEILITEKSKDYTGYATLPYLLKKHQITYHYSATLLVEGRSTGRKKARNGFLGFAPVVY